MPRSTKLRALASVCLLVCSAGAGALESVQSLAYGVTLYHFYQQDYFWALTELMVAQKSAAPSLGVHADNAELLRGGMSLSYGMDRQAQQIFTDMLTQPGATADVDRAWFYLGKIAWQRGDVLSGGQRTRTRRRRPPLAHARFQSCMGHTRAGAGSGPVMPPRAPCP